MQSARGDEETAAFSLRPVTPDDLPVILRHRRAMFREMGFPEAKIAAMDPVAESFFAAALTDGTYQGWFLETPGARVAAGAGVSFLRFYPGPREPLERRAWLLNVYTEPAFRRRGLARRLVQTAIEKTRGAGHFCLYLHASEFGRSLYEQLGFELSNEMRIVF